MTIVGILHKFSPSTIELPVSGRVQLPSLPVACNALCTEWRVFCVGTVSEILDRLQLFDASPVQDFP